MPSKIVSKKSLLINDKKVSQETHLGEPFSTNEKTIEVNHLVFTKK
jgi:hypothetical protein